MFLLPLEFGTTDAIFVRFRADTASCDLLHVDNSAERSEPTASDKMTQRSFPVPEYRPVKQDIMKLLSQ